MAEFEQPRNGPDVIFVAVGDHERVYLVQFVFNRPEVRQHEVHARLVRVREQHTAVHDEQTAVLFEDRHVAADLAEAAERRFALAEEALGLTIADARAALAQAQANLIDNAIKYTPAGGAVKLRARRRSSGEVEYSVTDTGPGVPDADRERVVQRFVRLDNSRTEPGSGLGLSLVTAVAEAHGGRVVLDEGPGAYGGFGPGLRVALVLPPASAGMI